MTKKTPPADAVPTGYTYDEAQKTFVVAPDWTRQEVAALRRLTELEHPLSIGSVPFAQAVITGWSDEDLQAVDIWALNSAHDGAEAGEFPGVPLEPPPVLDGAGAQTETASDSGAAVTGSAEDGVTSTAAIYPDALAALRDMGESRYGLYRYPGKPGEVSQFGASGPQHDGETVRDLIDAGLAVEELTGGAHGSVKITAAGRAALTRLAPAPL